MFRPAFTRGAAFFPVVLTPPSHPAPHLASTPGAGRSFFGSQRKASPPKEEKRERQGEGHHSLNVYTGVVVAARDKLFCFFGAAGN